MIKNYFIKLWEIIKNAFIFSNKTFKEYTLKIWGTILIQIGTLTPVLSIINQNDITSLSLVEKTILILGFIVFIFSFFFMYRLVFDLASFAFDKEKLSNKKIIFSLLTLGLLNLIPFIVFQILIAIALNVPNSAQILSIVSSVFSIIFYFLLCLSIASIVFWQDKKNIIAILKSIKVVFKKTHYALPLFSIIFIIASLILFLIMTAVTLINFYTNIFTNSTMNTIQTVANVYTLYLISGFYIGIQSEILKSSNQ